MKTLSYDTDVAIRYLKQLDRDGAHQLAAFDPSKEGEPGAWEFETFRPNNWSQMKEWIEARQGRCNQYYRLNEPRHNLGSKAASKKDITAIRAIGADFDPDEEAERQGGLAGERERLLNFINKDVKSYLECVPSFVVDTGGGYQTVWRLENKQSPRKCQEAAENQARGIAVKFESDPATIDIARLFRLPGTLNFPDSKKQKRGRVAPAPALLLESSRSTTTLEKLGQWISPQSAPQRGNTKNLPSVNMKDVHAAIYYGDLPETLRHKFERARADDPRLEALWGGDKDAVGGEDISGSGFLYALAGRLKPKGFSATELGQLTYVWDCYPNSEKLDARQIGRAWAKHPAAGPAGEEFEAIGSPSPADLWEETEFPADLPEGVLPESLEVWLQDIARRQGTTLGATAVAALVVCAAAMSARFAAQPKQHDTKYLERAILWAAIVGMPGAVKTSILAALAEPLEEIEKKRRAEDAPKLRTYRAELARWKINRKKGPEPIKPRERRKIVDNTTIEALAHLLVDNPDGLLCSTNELAQWAGNMDAYRAGKAGGVSRDQSFWLRAKDGRQYSVDRVASDPIYIPVCAVHVLGSIQPDIIRKVAGDWSGNGVMQRFLLTNVQRVGRSLDVPPDQEAYQRMRAAIGRLVNLKWHEFLDEPFTFSPEADVVRKRILNFRDHTLADTDMPPGLAGWVAKMEGEWARIALVLHFIKWASSPVAESQISGYPPQEIDRDTAERAARFLLEFQWPHQRYFYINVVGSGVAEESDARRLANYILVHQCSEIDERTMYRGPLKHLKGQDRWRERAEVARVLEVAGWLIPRGGHLWKQRTNKWKVNLHVHDGRFAERAEDERRRIETANKSMTEAFAARRAANM